MIDRNLELSRILKRKSLFLFGPRQTGKSTFLRKKYPEALYINLLKPDEYEQLTLDPALLRKKVSAFKKKKGSLVIIDEIQKLPYLTNEVQNLIFEYAELRFILTGSSARKLKMQGVNLLGGRASWVNMHPLNDFELKRSENSLSFDERLLWGSLPPMVTSEEKALDIADYIQLYITQEIQQEGLVRRLPPFRRFLTFAALSNSQILNYTSLGNDAQLAPTTVADYYSILEDTLIGQRVSPFSLGKSRKAISKEKFYFFDTGVANALCSRRELINHSNDFGVLFENYIYNEIKTYIDYKQLQFTINFWRTYEGSEIDFIIYESLNSPPIAIEVKSTTKLRPKDFQGFKDFCEECTQVKSKILVCQAPSEYLEDDVRVLPVQTFLSELWSGSIF